MASSTLTEWPFSVSRRRASDPRIVPILKHRQIRGKCRDNEEHLLLGERLRTVCTVRFLCMRESSRKKRSGGWFRELSLRGAGLGEALGFPLSGRLGE